MHLLKLVNYLLEQGWSGGAMVLGKLPVPGRLTIWVIVGQGPIALAVGAGVGCLDIFSLHYLSFAISPSLWETARYRLKYYLKGPLNPKQPTNQPISSSRLTNHCLTFTSTSILLRIEGNSSVGIWCQNDVVSTSVRRQHVTSTLIRPPVYVSVGYLCTPVFIWDLNVCEIVHKSVITEKV